MKALIIIIIILYASVQGANTRANANGWRPTRKRASKCEIRLLDRKYKGPSVTAVYNPDRKATQRDGCICIYEITRHYNVRGRSIAITAAGYKWIYTYNTLYRRKKFKSGPESELPYCCACTGVKVVVWTCVRVCDFWPSWHTYRYSGYAKSSKSLSKRQSA